MLGMYGFFLFSSYADTHIVTTTKARSKGFCFYLDNHADTFTQLLPPILCVCV